MSISGAGLPGSYRAYAIFQAGFSCEKSDISDEFSLAAKDATL
jgi:hypothetical protein